MDDMVGKDTRIEPSDWQMNANNVTNASIGMIPVCNSMVESSVCSSGPMVDSFGPHIWNQPMNGPHLGYGDVGVQNAMMRGGMFLPPVLPQSLPNFPADSAFIERAARFSCFSGGSFSEMLNPFSVPDPLNPYPRLSHEVFGRNGSKPLHGMELQRHETSMTDQVSKEAKRVLEVSPFKNEKKCESEVKQGVNGSGNESDEAEFSGRGPQDELDSGGGESSGLKKRKRGGQDTQNDEVPKPCSEAGKEMVDVKQKSDQSKPGGKNVKQGSQGSDGPKEDYIHVRARRGQATNSHSLAERVRREKISERMKFLQDLVPGCSKVTGKAVMLDEIINYVQSLQRQVEFLSMKLATVNPRLDFNIEGLLAKDMLQPRAGMSSSPLALLPDMSMHFPQIHPPQPGLIQACLSGNSVEALRRPINLQGFKESTSQVSSVWEDELHNVVHMGFNSNALLNTQDLTGSLPQGHMKAEP